MRKWSAVLSIVGVMLFVPNALAYDCSSRLFWNIYPGPWWEYAVNHLDTSDSACWTMDTYSTWNSSASKWEFTAWYQQSATRVISVPSTDSGTSTWIAQLDIDFYDPHAEWWEFLGAQVDVNHNGSHSYYNIYSNHGNSGTSVDSGPKWVNFSAVSGDTITILVVGNKSYSDAHVRFGNVYVFRLA